MYVLASAACCFATDGVHAPTPPSWNETLTSCARSSSGCAATSNKEGYADRLEVLLRARTERMDELANTIATLREQNRRLNEEADHLAEMVRMSPGDAP